MKWPKKRPLFDAGKFAIAMMGPGGIEYDLIARAASRQQQKSITQFILIGMLCLLLAACAARNASTAFGPSFASSS